MFSGDLFELNSHTNWITTLEEACLTFKKGYSKPPNCILMGAETIEEVSYNQGLASCHVQRDLLGRINLIIHDNFVLDVLITSLPYNKFSLTNIGSDISCGPYIKVLETAVENLITTRNNVLDYIKHLSLKGEMNDVTEMFAREGIQIQYYNLDDFKSVEDSNVRELTTLWHSLNESIMVLEDDSY